MKKTIAVLYLLAATGASASWYWPFGDDDEEKKPPRLSELMEPASLLIDDASDLAMDGKITEAIEKYREALAALDKVERENPDRAESPEFATLRNKRAYVNAAMDSIILAQARQNAKAVAVSDTTELEKRFAEEKAARSAKKSDDTAASANKPSGGTAAPDVKDEKREEKDKSVAVAEGTGKKRPEPVKPKNKREQAIRDIVNGDYNAAMLVISEMLEEKPNGAAALNLRAVCETRQGRFKEAEKTLDQAIMSNPRDFHAYYNMAHLMLQSKGAGGKNAARRYYETGRAVGGPQDETLKEAVK